MTSIEFEKTFEKAVEIRFLKTENYNIEPPIIAIIFENEIDGIEPYKFLQNNLTKDEISLVFRFQNGSKINMSIINKKNTDVFNISNLKFSNSNLKDFRKNGEFGKYCVFCISQIINNQLIISNIVKDNPLLVSEIIFSEQE